MRYTVKVGMKNDGSEHMTASEVSQMCEYAFCKGPSFYSI